MNQEEFDATVKTQEMHGLKKTGLGELKSRVDNDIKSPI
jgi:hypothetical protein